MDHKAFFLKHWNHEAKATREVISRIPENADYRPDPKSRTAREIAWLIVHEDRVLVEGLEAARLEWAEAPAPATMREVLESYDREHEGLGRRLEALNASVFEQEIPFIFGGQEVMREIGHEMAWGFLKDQIHHRGQLSTYLRPVGAKVPQIYGPTADEPWMPE